MAARHDRALNSLMGVSQRGAAFIQGLKDQAADVAQVGADALSGRTTTERLVADVTALWINGATLVGQLWGLPDPAGPGGGAQPGAFARVRRAASEAAKASEKKPSKPRGSRK